MNDGLSIIIFDLPTTSKKDKREASNFRRQIKKNGYIALQKSIYYKYLRNIKSFIREYKYIYSIKIDGSIKMFKMTMNDFNKIININGDKPKLDDFAEVIHL